MRFKAQSVHLSVLVQDSESPCTCKQKIWANVYETRDSAALRLARKSVYIVQRAVIMRLEDGT